MSNFDYKKFFSTKCFSETCNYEFSESAINNIQEGRLKLVVHKRGPPSIIDNLSVYIGNVTGYIVLYVGGNNNTLFIENGVAGSYDLRLWRDSTIKIGEKTTSNGIRVECDKSDFLVGKDCMFSDTILVQTSVQHGIVCLVQKEIINIGHKVTQVGDHVWVGRGATLTSNIQVGEGSIVGTGSIVTADVPSFTIVAGVPARVIKSNTSWSRFPERFCETSQKYIDEVKF